MENYIFYTTGTFSSAILPEKCKIQQKTNSLQNMYLTLPRVVLHSVVNNGSITLRVNKLVTLGKIILRYPGLVSKLLVKSITGNVTLCKIAVSKIILDRFRLHTAFLGNITVM